MKIFLLGGTGCIGRALVARLLIDGHALLGLARSKASLDALTKLGAEGVLIEGGDANASALAAAASSCDAVIYAATGTPHTEAALRSILHAMSPGQVLIHTSGSLAYGDVPGSLARPATEGSSGPTWHEPAVLQGAADGLRTGVLRVPWVYGSPWCRHSEFQSEKYSMHNARRRGGSLWVDDGRAGETSMVHVDDLAELYALTLRALAAGTLPAGSILNAASGRISHRARAESISAACGGLPVWAVSPSVGKYLLFFNAWELWVGTYVCVQDSSKAISLGWAPAAIPFADYLASMPCDFDIPGWTHQPWAVLTKQLLCSFFVIAAGCMCWRRRYAS